MKTPRLAADSTNPTQSDLVLIFASGMRYSVIPFRTRYIVPNIKPQVPTLFLVGGRGKRARNRPALTTLSHGRAQCPPRMDMRGARSMPGGTKPTRRTRRAERFKAGAKKGGGIGSTPHAGPGRASKPRPVGTKGIQLQRRAQRA